ncbi:TDT family transporter [Staphylococcus argenteus]|uniref:TDT family transporter n=1 Tax=Staphylococcus argenteus TaxID=985002 RepID=UPI000918D9A0|nr:TDT family transporter [Staphylococcus argenteus]MCG9853485.1 TDT family transporter [Staphylococcus argenteus]MDR7648931.1 TDT family transporter [Staphylococcus argenteus]MDR7681633.1 TDT family transporter [Staphylococcus argenteus]SGW49346.1 Exfoliative toxin A [Staphylococcus argenteus]SGX23698.1 Exfoliative toxin A [Staphylococcus argenteus]
MRLQKAPLVTSGLVLGLLGLGNLLKDISLAINALCGIFAFLIWLHLLCTMFKNYNTVKEQLNNPLISSVFTTFFMSGFLGTTYLKTFFSNITIINSLITPLWILCLVGIMTHMIIFSFKYLKGFSFENVYPSWTVLFIGIAVAGLTAPVSGYYLIGKLSVIYGFVATCIVLPIVFKRIKIYPLQASIKPNISTICAPFSLVAASYVIAFPKTNAFIVIAFLILAQTFYFYIIIQLPKLLKEPFSPVFSAFTFPLVISATALKNSLPVLMFPIIWKGLLFFEILLATIIVFRVLLGYIHYFFKSENKNKLIRDTA